MIYTEYRDLDIAKGDKSHTLVEPIYLRQGEGNGTKILATVYDGNKVLNVTGYSVAFCMENPDGQYVEPVAGVVENGANGQISVTVTHDMTEVPGTTEIAYFQLKNGSEIVDTDSIELKILDSYDLSPRADDAYKTKIEKLIEYLEVLKETFTDIKNIAVTYKAGPSGTTAPTGTYTAAIPTVGQGEFLWAKVQVNYSNGTNQAFYMCARQGKDNTTWGVATPTADGLMSAADKKRLDEINDCTTGINLLRRTRNFGAGTEKLPGITTSNAYYEDGFRIQSSAYKSFYEDEEGYTVLNIKRSDSSSGAIQQISSAFYANEANVTYTLSFEFMYKNDITLDNPQDIAKIVHAKSDGTALRTVYAPIDLATYEPNKWHTVTVKIVSQNPNGEIGYIWCCAEILGNGNCFYRKLCVYKGNINNPIYSVAPTDMALEPINDITIGTNLLRGTRDFTNGTLAWNGQGFFVDGFWFSPTYPYTFTKDEAGFTVATRKNTSATTSSIRSNAITDFSNGRTFTAFFEFKIEDISAWVKQSNSLVYQSKSMENLAGLVDNAGVSLDTILGVDTKTLESNKWYKAKYTFTISDNADAFIVILQNSNVGTISFRKLGIYSGKIKNPEWSANPIDLVTTAEFLGNTRYSLENLFTANDGFTIDTQVMRVSGAIAQLYILLNCSKALQANNSYLVGTLDQSVCPALSAGLVGRADGKTTTTGWISSDGGIRVNLAANMETNKQLAIYATYIIGQSFFTTATLELPGGQIPIPLPSLGDTNNGISTLLPDDRQIEIEPLTTD